MNGRRDGYRRTFTGAVALLCGWLGGCARPAAEPGHDVVPNPLELELSRTERFELAESTRIEVARGSQDGLRIAGVLARLIGNSAETTPAVLEVDQASVGAIHMAIDPALESLGPEAYQLDVAVTGVSLRGAAPAGLFYGVQTLRHLLPPLVEYTAAYPRPLSLPVGTIRDMPRFEWRGLMLDVSRHFLPVEDVKRFIDHLALYKMNRLHLHLSDDQGWRIEIPGWPNLTEYGGSTEVGGGPGGYYTTDEYAELVAYADARFVTLVPEIDVPGHTNAALASYPELNCDGVAPDLYTGTAVGFSSLCPDLDVTYRFLDDVIREISERTSGPYFHVGGDEVEALSDEQYTAFVERVQEIVARHGKRMVGWDEVANAGLRPESIVQLWRPLWPEAGEELSAGRAEAAAVLGRGLTAALDAGARVVLSPANRLYLDMKYNPSTVTGLSWAGVVDVRTAYDWEVGDLFGSIPEVSIVGVEAPVWSETLGVLSDFEYMAFPRIAAVAELGWSAAHRRDWGDFRVRLGAQADRWDILGIRFRRSPGIPWSDGLHR